jgi:hypothetical protein
MIHDECVQSVEWELAEETEVIGENLFIANNAVCILNKQLQTTHYEGFSSWGLAEG